MLRNSSGCSEAVRDALKKTARRVRNDGEFVGWRDRLGDGFVWMMSLFGWWIRRMASDDSEWMTGIRGDLG